MIVILIVMLFLSIAINILFAWYAFKLIKRFFLVQETFQIFDSQMEEFSEHLKKIYELEMFYGDSTLESLIQHTKFITQAYSDLKTEYSLVTGEVDATSENEEEELQPKEFQFKPIDKRLK